MTSVDPDGIETELLGRHMVVKEALRKMQDGFFW
jgi:hypothetical protein